MMIKLKSCKKSSLIMSIIHNNELMKNQYNATTPLFILYLIPSQPLKLIAFLRYKMILYLSSGSSLIIAISPQRRNTRVVTTTLSLYTSTEVCLRAHQSFALVNSAILFSAEACVSFQCSWCCVRIACSLPLTCSSSKL